MAKRAKPLTSAELKGLRGWAESNPDAPEKRRADGGQKGLYVRVRGGRVEFWHRSKGSRRSWSYIDTYPDSTLDQARTAARERRGWNVAGRDVGEVLAEQRRQALTVADIFARYLRDFERRAESGAKRGRQSSCVEASRMLNRAELAGLRKLPAGQVTAEQVRNAHRKMADRPGAANRTLTAMRAAFAFGAREGLVSENPCEYVGKLEERGSRRALTRGELEALGEELHRTDNPRLVLLVRLLALTGMRLGEVVGHRHTSRGTDSGLKWRHVNLDAGTVELRTKTGDQVRVVGAKAIELLKAAKPDGVSPNAYVLPGEDGDAPYRAVNNSRRRLWKRAGLPDVRGCDLHSLRHSFASIGAHVQDGRYAGLVSALLGHGHQAKAITERYIHDDVDALRPAADAIAGEIARLLGLAEAAKVVEHPSAKRA